VEHIEDCTIVLILLKMVEQYLKTQGSGIGILSLEGNPQLIE
jgi:hypothetical protein